MKNNSLRKTRKFGPGPDKVIREWHKRFILIVDDDPEMRRLMREIIPNDRFVVLEAKDGREGLKRLKKERIDLLILNMSMPRMGGWEVLQHMTDDTRLSQIPTIISTAMCPRGITLPENIQRTMRLAWHERPFDASLLVRHIDQHFTSSIGFSVISENHADDSDAPPTSLTTANTHSELWKHFHKALREAVIRLLDQHLVQPVRAVMHRGRKVTQQLLQYAKSDILPATPPSYFSISAHRDKIERTYGIYGYLLFTKIHLLIAPLYALFLPYLLIVSLIGTSLVSLTLFIGIVFLGIKYKSLIPKDVAWISVLVFFSLFIIPQWVCVTAEITRRFEYLSHRFFVRLAVLTGGLLILLQLYLLIWH